ncbi:hypothetical protein KRP22_014334 [Phytophthora ramorum]|nr:hypothetical protein KRP22_9065 [Phytophthora ramorum]
MTSQQQSLVNTVEHEAVTTTGNAANRHTEGATNTAADSETDKEGFQTKEPRKIKSAKAKARKGKREADPDRRRPQRRTDGQETAVKIITGHKKETKATNKSLPQGSSGQRPTKRFEKFQREEALGRYGALADSDSDEVGSEDMEVDEENTRLDEDTRAHQGNDAPYAFTEEGAHTHQAPLEQTETDPQRTGPEEDDPMDETYSSPTVDDSTFGGTNQTSQTRDRRTMQTTSTSTSSRRICPNSTGVGLPDMAIKGMQNSMANFMHQATTIAAKTIDNELEHNDEDAESDQDRSDTIMPATPDSQKDFTMGGSRTGTNESDDDLPIQSEAEQQRLLATVNYQAKDIKGLRQAVNNKLSASGLSCDRKSPVLRSMTSGLYTTYLQQHEGC